MKPFAVLAMGSSSAPAFSATASPANAIKGGTTSTLTTPPVTTTPAGGTPPYTYAWVLSSQTGTKTVAAVNPTNATTTFQITGSGPGDTGTCNAVCTVTDSLSDTADTNTVGVMITNTS